MENVKNWYESKALWGNIVGVLVMGLSMFGLISPEGGQIVIKEVPEFAIATVGLIAAIVGFYGRMTAKHVIGRTADVKVDPEDRIREIVKAQMVNADTPRG